MPMLNRKFPAKERASAIQPVTLLATAGLLIVTIGCSKATGTAAAPAPLQVRVADVRQMDVPLYQEWIGTLDGLVNADIKAQVSGYLISQTYVEGNFVKKGQPLFQIDPRPFQAALDRARGQLAQAEGQLVQARAQQTLAEAQVAVAQANQRRTQLDVDRYTPLAQQQAITQQDLDNATQNNIAAQAQLQAAKAQVETVKAQIITDTAAVQSATAAVETARIELGFTSLTAPIDGIPGIAQQQVGALVSPASGPITTVSTVDPIKVYFNASEQQYMQRGREFPTAAAREASRERLEFDLILADGSVYAQKGKFYSADRQVDVKTGAIRIAALFANPNNYLRPGQYGRVRTALNIEKGALLVPQQAVIDLQGTRQLAIVDDGGKVRIQPVKVGETFGNEWIIREGVKAGEHVVVDGIQQVRPGMKVISKPFETR